MSRHTVVFDELKERGYDITSYKLLSGGINSSVFRVISSNQKCFVLKLYPMPSSDDPRNRCHAEINFLGYLRFCDITSCPKILEFNLENAWSLISWIDGEKPTSLSTMQLHQIIDFIYSINRPELYFMRNKLKTASDAYKSLHCFAHAVMQRISRFYSSDISNDISYQAIFWIRTTIEPLLVDLIHDISKFPCSSGDHESSASTMIASPSDFGIHNMLRKNDKLYFIDFEYAGIDDIVKLFADFILQPNLPFDLEQEKYFLGLASSKFVDILDEHWLYRYNKLKPLFVIKWSLIMLNRLKSGLLDEHQFSKTLSYFDRYKTIFF